MAQATGYRLREGMGADVSRGGAEWLRLDHIASRRVDPSWGGIEVLVACDVTNPLLGPQGASHVYGPQKGADDQTVELLDRALANFAAVVERDLGKEVADVPGAGAAGGSGAGPIAFLHSPLIPAPPLVVPTPRVDEH